MFQGCGARGGPVEGCTEEVPARGGRHEGPGKHGPLTPDWSVFVIKLLSMKIGSELVSLYNVFFINQA